MHRESSADRLPVPCPRRSTRGHHGHGRRNPSSALPRVPRPAQSRCRRHCTRPARPGCSAACIHATPRHATPGQDRAPVHGSGTRSRTHAAGQLAVRAGYDPGLSVLPTYLDHSSSSAGSRVVPEAEGGARVWPGWRGGVADVECDACPVGSGGCGVPVVVVTRQGRGQAGSRLARSSVMRSGRSLKRSWEPRRVGRAITDTAFWPPPPDTRTRCGGRESGRSPLVSSIINIGCTPLNPLSPLLLPARPVIGTTRMGHEGGTN